MKSSEIRAYAQIMKDAGLTLFEVEENGIRIRMERGVPVAAATSAAVVQTGGTGAAASVAASAAAVQSVKMAASPDSAFLECKAPMVGVFYASSAPDAETFIKVGSRVKRGDVLGIIEAMKLMNDITAEFDGEIVDICVDNAQVVEYGQTLFRLKGTGGAL